MGPLQWGDVPTAVGALFAGGAAWFALQTIKSQRQQIGEQRQFIGDQLRFMAEQQQNLALERAELRAAAEDRRWSQARKVEVSHVRAASTVNDQGEALVDHWLVIVANRSDSPVHQVDVRFGTAYTAHEVHEWNPQRSHPTYEPGERVVAPVDLVGPGRAVRFASQRWSSATVHNNRPTVYFTDDSGVRWSKDWYGKRDEVPTAEPPTPS
ncbi:hypothetical protein GCM10010372_30710 [Streptomyces tauricus]|uniref:hypothetical protein n=1 Tax=Streptomyces tauricus TaxID=68274 RepID=UPI001679FBCA|nr:hypothetical protein [Streptomyces tauricus]GHA28749.1 hypothetical protein GCM10010372_30710 [Streptomyces tauricus]